MSTPRVFKFGGASVKNADAVRNVASVIRRFQGEKLLIVVSAMGKTTNLLEELVKAYYYKTGKAQELFGELKRFHDEIVAGLLSSTTSHVYDEIDNLFIELGCLIEQDPEESFECIYDQVVAFGEIISTRIVSAYLNEAGINNRWMDARNFVQTDERFRAGRIDWNTTIRLIQTKLAPIVNKQIVMTQGFIGRSSNNYTTTLGREGSDYSAAIFAYGLDASSVTIWKDVAGVMNADPKRIPDAVKLDHLNYNEAIELAYYGATVIHPKTIQPLKSKNIPLLVRSFIDPEAPGTVVNNEGTVNTEQEFYIFKDNQALISIASRDFSFIVEDHLSRIFSAFAAERITINLMQNSAISFSVCVNYEEQPLEKLSTLLSSQFDVNIQKGATLLTIRNALQVPASLLNGKAILIEQRTGANLQVVVA